MWAMYRFPKKKAKTKIPILTYTLKSSYGAYHGNTQRIQLSICLTLSILNDIMKGLPGFKEYRYIFYYELHYLSYF